MKKNKNTIREKIDQYDEEEMFLKAVVQQMIKEKNSTAYVYNKNVVDELEKTMPNLEIKKKEFYWTVKRKDINQKPLTKKKICEELYISRPTFDKWLELGCPSHEIAGRNYFMLEEVQEWVKSK